MFNYSNVLIYGYSLSGQACEKVLKHLNVNYKILDDNLHVSGGKYVCKLTKKELLQFDLVVVSPSILKTNKIVVLAEKLGISVIGELEFAYYFCNVPIIAVTGTNGKTTTTKLITHILNQSGLKAVAYGNVGNPFSNVFFEENLNYAVVEVSSFQLETINKFKPNIGVILNIDADHLDRHKTIENYINLKIDLFKNCNKNVQCVVNGGDKNITICNHKIMATKNYFCTNINLAQEIKKYKKTNIVSISDGKVVNLTNKRTIVNLNALNVSPVFYEDVLASVLATELCGISEEEIANAILTFNWLKHRTEFLGEINGVKFYNDSKATNVHATINAVLSFKSDVVLLLGGQDKDLNFDALFEVMENNVKHIVLFGQARHKILKTAKKHNFKNVCLCEHLTDAVTHAYGLVTAGSVLLLSPGCTSFDDYNSYAERGEHFREIFNTLKNNNKISGEL